MYPRQMPDVTPEKYCTKFAFGEKTVPENGTRHSKTDTESVRLSWAHMLLPISTLNKRLLCTYMCLPLGCKRQEAHRPEELSDVNVLPQSDQTGSRRRA